MISRIRWSRLCFESAEKVRRLDLLPDSVLVACPLTFFYKMKHEGKILFGRNIRGETEPRFTVWDKLKAIWVPQSIAFLSFILALLLLQKSVAYAVKALFNEVESACLSYASSLMVRV